MSLPPCPLCRARPSSRRTRPTFLPWLLLISALGVGSGPGAWGAAPPALTLKPEAVVDGKGVLFAALAEAATGASLPALKLSDAPAVGPGVWLTREQVNAWLRRHAPAWATTNWGGADRVHVTRRPRTLDETGMLRLLTGVLQREVVRSRGTLELQVARVWPPPTVPDDPLTLQLVELPATGLASTMALHFQLLVGTEMIGEWQTVVRARVFQEVLVAATSLQRGQPVGLSDFNQERRDILALHDPLTELPAAPAGLEMAQNLTAGAPLYERALELRPVVFRGAVVKALLTDGAVSISLRVEVLENGAPGQVVRVRNLRTHKEFRGKVENEQTILVSI